MATDGGKYDEILIRNSLAQEMREIADGKEKRADNDQYSVAIKNIREAAHLQMYSLSFNDLRPNVIKMLEGAGFKVVEGRQYNETSFVVSW